MYVDPNFKTKKAFKEAVAKGERIIVYQPMQGDVPFNGEVSIEGPHYPEPHRWYARCTIKAGIIVKVG